MKEHITPKQAQQITEDQFYSLFSEIVKRDDWYKYHHKKVTIGKLIEFLTPINMHCYDHIEEWKVQLIGDKHLRRIDLKRREFFCPELVDALWEAAKEVLRHPRVRV